MWKILKVNRYVKKYKLLNTLDNGTPVVQKQNTYIYLQNRTFVILCYYCIIMHSIITVIIAIIIDYTIISVAGQYKSRNGPLLFSLYFWPF